MKRSPVGEYISAFKGSKTFGHLICYSHIEEESPPDYKELKRPLDKQISFGLQSMGIRKLFSHQAKAIELIRNKRHIVISTPTASGKSLVYNIPILESILKNKESRSLYLFPLKALAQDQLRNLENLSANISFSHSPKFGIYDGDTSSWQRTKIRKSPPNCLFTNPDMLHLSLLPYHDSWSLFWKNLEFVVIDEVHTYRGIMGSNMGWAFRRLRRICKRYGSDPTFIVSSATIGNPGELASELTGLEFEVITKSGAPQGKRHLLLVDPQGAGAAQTAVQLILAALKRDLRTICYTQSRKLTELVSLWISQRAGSKAKKVSAYRAGFLPEERRYIERQLASGELLAVISTSALELGIDIGFLDICVLVGYPGTLMSLRQRSGRVGRSTRESAVILVAGEDALDKYFIENPRELIERPSEKAVINILNPKVVKKHLVCAASEEPISIDEEFFTNESIKRISQQLLRSGRLFLTGDGKKLVTSRRYPQREVDLRGTGRGFQIVLEKDGKTIGTVDGYRAFKETHPGAIYLHKGITYKVIDLDIDARLVLVQEVKADYFTRVRSSKDTEVIDIRDRKYLFGTYWFWGKLLITDQVVGYDVRHIRGQRLINRVDLELPPQRFETEGFWFVIPNEVKSEIEGSYYHFMGGIHAIEHALIGIMPLVVLCDRNDLGGISTTFHHQTQQAAIFVYDGVPGGVGLTRQAFITIHELLKLTLNTIKGCKCDSGCPSCVHSPKCGSGNRPIDKKAAILVLEKLIRKNSHKLKKAELQKPNLLESLPKDTSIFIDMSSPPFSFKNIRFGVLDIETQRSAQDVGGWHRADKMRVSCAVLYDSQTNAFCTFLEDQLPHLFNLMKQLDIIVGFNIKGFDYRVLSGYSDMSFWSLPTFDILEEVKRSLGYRLSLDALARATLGTKKSGNGLLALKWWKLGQIRKIIEYCKKDVALTRDLFVFGMEKDYLLFKNKSGSLVRLPTFWQDAILKIINSCA